MTDQEQYQYLYIYDIQYNVHLKTVEYNTENLNKLVLLERV